MADASSANFQDMNTQFHPFPTLHWPSVTQGIDNKLYFFCYTIAMVLDLKKMSRLLIELTLPVSVNWLEFLDSARSQKGKNLSIKPNLSGTIRHFPSTVSAFQITHIGA